MHCILWSILVYNYKLIFIWLFKYFPVKLPLWQRILFMHFILPKIVWLKMYHKSNTCMFRLKKTLVSWVNNFQTTLPNADWGRGCSTHLQQWELHPTSGRVHRTMGSWVSGPTAWQWKITVAWWCTSECSELQFLRKLSCTYQWKSVSRVTY